MVQIAPFRALYYNPERIPDLALVATPPYDVITEEEAERFRRRHPHNMVHLILPRGEGGYERAGCLLRQWEGAGVLIRDEIPSLYLYQQVFIAPSGVRMVRNGFICLVRLEAFGEGVILPHEETTSRPVEDRLRLMEACAANLSQVFALYSDPDREIEGYFAHLLQKEPRCAFGDDYGVIHRLWQLGDKGVITRVAAGMKQRPLLIADGHHRYKTSLIYRDIMRERYPAYTERSPFEYAMLYLTPMEGDGLLILPTHRLVNPRRPFAAEGFLSALKRYFDLREFPFSDEKGEVVARHSLFAEFDSDTRGHSFALYIYGEKRYIHLTAREGIKDLLEGYTAPLRELDVTVADGFIIKELLRPEEEVGLMKDRDEALAAVHAGRYQVAILMRPPTIPQVRSVVRAGELMPRKTTYFYPKVASGLVINKIVPEEEVALP